MLNELSLLADSLAKLGTVADSRHPRINPMGKNRDLLVVFLDGDGEPSGIELLAGETAATLFRVEHGSAGSSFPGFNIPTPLRQLEDAPIADLEKATSRLLALGKIKDSSASEHAEAVRNLLALSKPRTFREGQNDNTKESSAEKQFQRSVIELVSELAALVASAPSELANFKTLLQIIIKAKPTLPMFAESIVSLVKTSDCQFDRRTIILFQDMLFGTLDWKKCVAQIGSPEYWEEKAKQDKSANQPIYLDLVSPDTGCWRVAHPQTSALINSALLNARPKKGTDMAEDEAAREDAFGQTAPLQDKFPTGPKVAELGNVKLFSVNTNEVQALQRYRFKGSQSFPVSEALVQKMSDALLHLGSEDKRGITCRAIPSSQPDKRDLLVAYLEGEPEDRTPLAEMFGGEANAFTDADFEAIAKPVLEMLEGKVAANPNLNIRLLSFSPIDKAKKQISLSRFLRVWDVIRSVKEWENGARNAPEVSVWFYDKDNKRSVFRSYTAPCPLELATVANRVWSADAKSGFSSSYQRVFSVGDAYDVFLTDSPLAKQKAELALEMLIRRMSTVLAALGAVKTTSQWSGLSDSVRWQSLKSIALLGILLHQLGHHRKNYMQEPITQVGRLLALADCLHQQYCKHVRKGESPSQLIGNALFNTALDQPVFALARLAERLTPYQAWARTFQSNDPEAGVGLVKYFLSEIAASTAGIRVEDLPSRMADTDKAKLLLGYLADHPKNETQKQEAKN